MRCSRFMKIPTKSVAELILAFAVLSSLSGCAIREDSTYYSQLAPRAETNPSPTAIVGMWHYNGDSRAKKSSTSLLFRSNGEGLYRGRYQYTDGVFSTVGEMTPTEFTWHYEGGGKWSDSIGGTYQMADGKLLRSAHQFINTYFWETLGPTGGVTGPTNRVFERLE